MLQHQRAVDDRRHEELQHHQKSIFDNIQAAGAAELLEVAAIVADADKSSAEEIAEAAGVAQEVQDLEPARIQLVVMHHLEQNQMQMSGGGYQEDVGRLRQQFGSIAEGIEEFVSDLKYAIAELIDIGS